MQRRKLLSSRHQLTAIAVLFSASLGGCNDYLKRRDTITLSAGEAQSWNRAVHVTDPWPPYVVNTRIEGDGQRVSRAVERYREGNVTAIPVPAVRPPTEKSASGGQPTNSQPQ